MNCQLAKALCLIRGITETDLLQPLDFLLACCPMSRCFLRDVVRGSTIGSSNALSTPRAGGTYLLLTGCARPLPELPQLTLGGLQPEVRNAIEGEAVQARANPRDAYRVLRLAMVLHAHGQFQAAAKCYSRAWMLDPQRFETIYCWAQALASMGTYPRAAERLRQALAIRADSVPAQLKLAEVLRESGDTAGSAEICRRLLAKNPNLAEAHYGLGRTLEGAAATTEFQRALALFPRYGAAQFALADAYRKGGEAEKAKAALVDYERDRVEPAG